MVFCTFIDILEITFLDENWFLGKILANERVILPIKILLNPSYIAFKKALVVIPNSAVYAEPTTDNIAIVYKDATNSLGTLQTRSKTTSYPH